MRYHIGATRFFRVISGCLWLFFAQHSLTSIGVAGDPVTALVLSPEGTSLITGSHEGLFRRSGDQFEDVQRLTSDVESIHDLRFSSDGRLLAVAGGTPGQFGLTEIVKWPEATLVARIREHDDVIYAVSWSPDGKWLATASLDGACLICDSASGLPVQRIEGHSKGVTGIDWIARPSSESNGSTSLILTCSLDQTLRVWSLDTEQPGSGPKLLRTMDQHTGAVRGIARQPQTSNSSPAICASWGDDRTVRFWQPDKGRLLRFARLPDVVTAAVWSSDGRELFAAMESGELSRIRFSNAVVENIGGRKRALTSLVRSQNSARVCFGDSDGLCGEIVLPE